MTVKVKQTILIIVELITAYLIGAAFVASFCALILSRWGGVGHNRPLAQIAVVIRRELLRFISDLAAGPRSWSSPAAQPQPKRRSPQ